MSGCQLMPIRRRDRKRGMDMDKPVGGPPPRQNGVAIALALVVLLLAAFSVVLIIYHWDWLRAGADEQESRGATLRNVGLLMAGGLALIFALWRSWVGERQTAAAQRQAATAQVQAATAQESLRHDRYQRGAEMLGSSVLSVRLGGIYALKRLGLEHPVDYHLQVMELLCAFVRNPTDKEEPRDWQHLETLRHAGPAPKLREDLQAIMTAMAARPETGLALESENAFRLNLRGAYLPGLQLAPGTNLAGADLTDAVLVHSRLLGADVSRAILDGANMSRVNFIEANLSASRLLGAKFFWAIGQGANFSGAQISGKYLNASLLSANFSNAHISGGSDFSAAGMKYVNLSGVAFSRATRSTIASDGTSTSTPVYVRLTQGQLDEAVADPNNPPSIADGTVDIDTGEPLVWRGGPPPQEGE